MSSQALISNKSSPLLISLTKDETVNLSYGLAVSLPTPIKNIIYTNCKANVADTTPLSGQEISFDVTRGGFWANGLIETGLRVTNTIITAGSSGSGAIGLSLYSDIQLRSVSRTIWTQSDVYCIARTQSSPVNKAASIYRRAHFLSTVTGALGDIVSNPQINISYTTMTPLYIPFFESQRNYLDLRMCEPLLLVCRFNTNAGMGLNATNAALSDLTFLNATARLHQWIVDYEPETVQALAIANWSINSPVDFLAHNSTTTGFGISATAVTGTYFNHVAKLATTVPAIAAYVYLRKKTATANSLADCSQIVPFDKFTVKLNNISFYEDVPKIVGTYEADTSGPGGIVVGSGASTGTITVINGNILKLCFATDTQNRSSYTGALAFTSINNPEVTLKSNADGATVDIVYSLEYWNNLTMSGANGSIVQSTSS